MRGFNKRVVTEATAVPSESLDSPPTKPEQVTDRCLHFRPIKRPPMARLRVLDDGRKDGQRVRLRSDCTVIGRTIGQPEADISIDHDGEISGRHAAIKRCWKEGVFRWLLCDLKSTNGVFVRVARCRLRDDREFLIGSRRYLVRFNESAGQERNYPPSQDSGSKHTVPFRPAETRAAASGGWIVESSNCKGLSVMQLPSSSCQLGSDSKRCKLVVENDAYVDPCSVRFSRDQKDRWMVEDLNSTNGLWVRVNRFRLKHQTQFQLGEQRFVFEEL